MPSAGALRDKHERRFVKHYNALAAACRQVQDCFLDNKRKKVRKQRDTSSVVFSSNLL